jgi:ribose-phosphate pyrophosphokinase
MKLFGGSASLDLTQKIGESLGVDLSPVDQHIFPDGERRIRISENVIDETAILVQSAYPPVDTNYMELFILIDAVKRSGAEFVTAVVPYFGYQRQDHIFRDGEAVSLEVVIRILENLGIDKLVSVDMHSAKIPSLFHIPVKHISALPVFASKIRKLEGRGEVGSTVLVSPDTGGISRIQKLSKLLDDMPFVALQKNRDLETGDVTIDAIKDGSLKGKKRAILVDDMISSGTTIVLAAAFLKKQGIKEVVVFGTHPIFSKDAPKLLQESVIKKVFVTDTVPVPKAKQFKKLEVLSIAPLLAEALKS